MKCEKCKAKMKVKKTVEYSGDIRIRYYRCPACGLRKKTVEN